LKLNYQVICLLFDDEGEDTPDEWEENEDEQEEE